MDNKLENCIMSEGLWDGIDDLFFGEDKGCDLHWIRSQLPVYTNWPRQWRVFAKRIVTTMMTSIRIERVTTMMMLLSDDDDECSKFVRKEVRSGTGVQSFFDETYDIWKRPSHRCVQMFRALSQPGVAEALSMPLMANHWKEITLKSLFWTSSWETDWIEKESTLFVFLAWTPRRRHHFDEPMDSLPVTVNEVW